MRVDRCERLDMDDEAAITGGGAASSSSSDKFHCGPSLATVPYPVFSGGGIKEERMMLGELATLALAERGVESPFLLAWE